MTNSVPLADPSRKLEPFEEHIHEITQRLGTRIADNTEVWAVNPAECNLRFESAVKGPPATASFLLTVTPKLCNMLGNLHGGCAATLIDVLSSVVLTGVGRPGVFSLGGVSRNLNVTYLRPLPEGSEIRLVSTVVQMGKRLAFLRSEIYRLDTGDVCVVSDHEKANIDAEVKI